MNDPASSYPPQVKKIYDLVLSELKLPKEVASEFSITLDSINDAYMQCLTFKLNEKQAEDLIIKMWKNSVTIKY